jgi:hypothetical protein
MINSAIVIEGVGALVGSDDVSPNVSAGVPSFFGALGALGALIDFGIPFALEPLDCSFLKRHEDNVR